MRFKKPANAADNNPLADPPISFRLTSPAVMKTQAGQLALEQLKRLGWNAGLIKTLHDQMADRPGANALFGLLPGDAKIKKEREKMAEALRKLLQPFYTNLYIRVAAKISVLNEVSKLAEHQLDHVIEDLEAELDTMDRKAGFGAIAKICDHPICDYNKQLPEKDRSVDEKTSRAQKKAALKQAKADKAAMHKLHDETLPQIEEEMKAVPPPEADTLQSIERDIDTHVTRSRPLQEALNSFADKASSFGKNMAHTTWGKMGDVVNFLKQDSPNFFTPSNSWDGWSDRLHMNDYVVNDDADDDFEDETSRPTEDKPEPKIG